MDSAARHGHLGDMEGEEVIGWPIGAGPARASFTGESVDSGTPADGIESDGPAVASLRAVWRFLAASIVAGLLLALCMYLIILGMLAAVARL